MNRQGRLLIRPLDKGLFTWKPAGDAAAPERGGSAGELVAAWQALGRPAAWLLLPPESVPLHRLDMSPREARSAQRTAAFRIEDRLASDVEDVHIATGRLEHGRVTVAVMDPGWLRDLLDPIDAAGLRLARCTPLQCILPIEPSRLLWTDGTRLAWRSGRDEAVRVVDIDAAAVALTELGQSGGDSHLSCLVDDGCDPATLETMVRGYGFQPQWRRVSTWQLAQEAPANGLIDVRQGVFAQPVPWRLILQTARLPAAGLGMAAMLQLAALGTEVWRLERADTQLRQAIEQEYRALYPEGQLVDAAAQLREQLRRLREDTQAPRFIDHFREVGDELARHPGLNLRSLRFDARRGELELELRAPGHGAVEALSRALEATGRAVDLRGSSARGEDVTARLTVR